MSALILLTILAIVLGVTLGKKTQVINEEPVNLKWWQNSTIYRCYVTSYVDSDGDGIGDFKGYFALLILIIKYRTFIFKLI